MSKKVAVLDLETDPFEYQKMVYPFAGGLMTEDKYIEWWSEKCVEHSIAYLHSEAERGNHYLIYAHNGGRFDYFYYLPYMARSMRIINNRIVQAWIGPHELRDSFAIMPFALANYQKTPIDYNLFNRDKRDAHKDEILAYLKDDCNDLLDLVLAFREEFGDALTIGSASLKELRKRHKFSTGSESFDKRIRKLYYYGGRNQVFKAGITKTPNDGIKIYDVNSMYPHVMKNRLHPVSTGIYQSNRVSDKTCFVSVEGQNDGAFPIRKKDGGLDFTLERGIFHVSIHEYRTAIQTGSFKPSRILSTLNFTEQITFDEFVTHFYDSRNHAKEQGDKIRALFYKFVLNSGYGKFAQDPNNYCEWYITPSNERPEPWHTCSKSCDSECRKLWRPKWISENQHIIWSKPLAEMRYYNVATGASITGAARAELLRGIKHSVDPYYCDTDSIICRELHSVPIHDSDLGSWKIEASGSTLAIAGKKLYVLFDSHNGVVKKAHKGARLTGEEIMHIAQGGSVIAENPVPTFRFDGTFSWQTRVISSTVKSASVI